MVAFLPRSQQQNQQVLGWNHSSHPFQHTDKTEWRNHLGSQLPKLFTDLLLIYGLQPWRPKYGTTDSSMLTDLASSLQGIVHLIYR